MYLPNQRRPFQPRSTRPSGLPPLPPLPPFPPSVITIQSSPYVSYANYQQPPMFSPAMTYQPPYYQGTSGSTTYHYPYLTTRNGSMTSYGTQQYPNMTSSYAPQPIYQPAAANSFAGVGGYNHAGMPSSRSLHLPPPTHNLGDSFGAPALQQHTGNSAYLVPGIENAGGVGQSSTRQTKVARPSTHTFGSLIVPPRPSNAIFEAPFQHADVTGPVLAPRTNNQPNAEVKLEKTIVKAEKVDLKELFDQQTLRKPLVSFNVPPTTTSAINQINALGKRKRSNTEEKVEISDKGGKDIAAQSPVVFENSRPSALNVLAKSRTGASRNQAFLAVIGPSSAPEQNATKVTFAGSAKSTNLPGNNSVIDGKYKFKGEVGIPLSKSFPNIRNQPILVAWPRMEDAPVLQATPPPIDRPARLGAQKEESPLQGSANLQTSKDSRVKSARSDSDQLSSQQYLRYATPEEMQELIHHIEEEQWKARAAATYERPRNSGECFADPNWHPYQCFVCNQTRNSWKQFRSHVEVSHSIIMKEKIRAWKCFHPTCQKVFGDRLKGIQHATEEHWRVFRTELPEVDEYGRTYVVDGWGIKRE